MKKNQGHGGKMKRIAKKDRRGKEQIDYDQEQEQFDVQDALIEEQMPTQQPKITKYQTPQETKQRLGLQTLKKVLPKKSKLEDDFFVVDGQQQSKGVDGYQQGVAEQLRTQYLRKQNKLYEQCSSSYAPNGFQDPIEYKGHTLCITGFQMTADSIYSCSKDRSIIKWDREKKSKQFISLGKAEHDHRSDILSLSLHTNENVLATAGDDCQIKLWDTRTCKLIDTLRGHKHAVNGVKFGVNSNNLCSVSSDLTFKQWDFSQRGLIQTFHEHNAEVLDIDSFNGTDFLTSANDHQIISWKTEKEAKVIYKGHDYAIDRVRSINLQRFVTACQDGSINLWHTKKVKPILKVQGAHKKGWISALDTLKQTNLLATAGIDHVVKIWSIEGEGKSLNLIKQIGINGIATDIKIKKGWLGVTECDQLRLGRWHTDKCRNKIKIFKAKS